jgi:hypothetical protein
MPYEAWLDEFVSLNRNISAMEILSYAGNMKKAKLSLYLTNEVVRHEDV